MNTATLHPFFSPSPARLPTWATGELPKWALDWAIRERTGQPKKERPIMPLKNEADLGVRQRFLSQGVNPWFKDNVGPFKPLLKAWLIASAIRALDGLPPERPAMKLINPNTSRAYHLIA